MSRVTISIGGHLETVEQATKLADAIVSEGLNDGSEWVETAEQARSIMREAVESSQPVVLSDNDHESGGNLYDIDDVIDEVQTLEKLFQFHNEGGADTIERTRYVNGEARQTSTDKYDYSGVLLSAREIRNALATDTPVESLLAELELHERNAGSDFPALTASPAVEAWLKIFGEKAA
ncbi:hypothetical protein HBA92_21435 [Ochrobactrum sp. MR28]|nr:hypothetical protein [Ochrobactrum sp. MR28]MBX8818828.1 hypothetical protein [Ochrobactrum sp. MR31]